MCLLEISTVSLDNVIIRLAKVMNNLGKDLKILIFKVIFRHQKLVESFKNNSVNFNFLKMCPIFVSSVHDFGKSDNDVFLIHASVV